MNRSSNSLQNIFKESLLIFSDSPEKFYQIGLNYSIKIVNSMKAGFHALMTDSFSIVLVDISDIGYDSLIFINEIDNIQPWLNIVLLSDKNSRNLQLKMQKIASVYILDYSENQKKMLHKLNSIFEKKIRKGTDKEIPAKLFSRYNELIYLTTNLFTQKDTTDLFSELAENINMLMPKTTIIFLEIKQENLLHIYSNLQISQQVAETFKSAVIHHIELLLAQNLPEEKIKTIIKKQNKNAENLEKVKFLASIPVIRDNELIGMFSITINGDKNIQKYEKNVLLYYSKYLHKNFAMLSNLQNQLIRDPLTELYNHGYLFNLISKKFNKSLRDKTELAFFMIDIDFFKNLNDSYGHRAGDMILKELGEFIQTKLPKNSSLARYGGDEFAVLLPETSLEKSEILADSLVKEVDSNVFRDCGYPVKLTVSIGFASSNLNIVNDKTTLLEIADRALYLAKKNGRNQFYNAGNFDSPKKIQRKEYDKINTPDSIKSIQIKKQNKKIIVVDDDNHTLQLFNVIAKRENFEIVTTNSPLKSLELIKEKPHDYDIALLDLYIPEMNGIKLAKEIKKISTEIVLLIMSGAPTTEHALDAIQAGVYNFIRKPFSINDLILDLNQAYEHSSLKKQLNYYHQYLEYMLKEKTRKLQTTLDDLQKAYMNTMETIVNVLEIHEKNISMHSQRVSKYSVLLAKEFGITNKEKLEKIKYGALFHDIGKIGIPDTILHKKSPLNKIETEIMQKHVQIGYDLIRKIPILQDVSEIVYSHHERYDGKGYPRQLAKEKICIGARIFAIVDAVDALQSKRPYQKEQKPEDIFREINKCSGTHFDPQIVNCFNKIYHKLSNKNY
ncbi:MAG: diguanylate cyclase [Verrucomicrobiota bacterium]|nr:diguanylate cyclase [Verrucomicrobiota bacterium]